MLQVERTATVITEQQTHNVDNLPTEIKQLVAFLDDWRDRELNLSSELTMASYAIAQAKSALHAAITQYEQSVLVVDKPENQPE